MATQTGLTLQDVIGYVYLTEQLKAVKTGIPDVLPPEFYGRAVTDDVIGDSAKYVVTRGVRKTARRTNYKSKARNRDLLPIGTRDVKLWHCREVQHLDVIDYQALRAYNSYEIQNFGQQELERQVTEFKQLFDNTKIAATCQMLASGKVFWDRDGNLRDATVSGGHDVDAGIPANNLNQLNGIIGASWATTTTDIPGDIRQVKQVAVQTTGYPIKVALYGINIPTYMHNNDFAKYYFARNPAMNDKFVSTGEIPDGAFGIDKWVPVYESFFVDYADAVKTFFSADTVAFLPSIDKTWWRQFEGTYPIPKTFQPLGAGSLASTGFDIVQGQFGYATVSHDPSGLENYYGDTRLSFIVNGPAVYIADVTP